MYLFDEFDAIGSERAAGNDVGEIRRVLNSFLQFLEQDESSSLIVAATNHPDTLDRALFRRFDDVVEYEHPPLGLVESALRNRLAPFAVAAVDWAEAARAGEGLSYSDLAVACESAAKEAVLDGTTTITTEMLLKALGERHAALRK